MAPDDPHLLAALEGLEQRFPLSDPDDRLLFKRSCALLYRSLEPPQALLEAVREAGDRARRAADGELYAYSLMSLATRRLFTLGDCSQETRELLDGALAAVTPSEHPKTYLDTLNMLGVLHNHRRELSAANGIHRAMLQAARELGDDESAITACTNVSYNLVSQGLAPAAVDELKRLEAELPQARNINQLEATFVLVAWSAGLLDAAAERLTLLRQANQAERDQGVPVDPTSMTIERDFGFVLAVERALVSGDPADRARAWQAFAHISEPGKHVEQDLLRVFWESAAARLERAEGRLDEARARMQRWADERKEWDATAAQGLELLAALHKEAGDATGALAALEEGSAIRRQLFEREGAALNRSLREKLDNAEHFLRAQELQASNDALRDTSRRLDQALLEAKESHAQAEQARAQAERAASARHRFLSSMSHELRTPIHGVLGPLELLQSTQLSSHQRELCDLMERSASLTLAVVNDVLDVGRLESGRMKVESAPFHLRDLVRDTTTILQTNAQAKALKLEARVDPRLPEWLLGDERRIAQILVNLLSNAVKFTDSGCVRLEVAPEGDQVAFMVQDSGCGMSADDLVQIFDPYGQAAHRPKDVEGTGLGLSICRGLTEAMGGSIQADSALGEGSTFTLRLTLPEAAPTQRGAASTSGSLRGLRVLVAEDNSVNQVVIRMMLESLGVLATVVPDGVAVMELTGQERYDLLLLDIHMPNLGGLMTARMLRRRGDTVPIIALTASTQTEEHQAAIEAGMDGFATKPIGKQHLVQVLHSALERRSHQAS